MSAPRRRPAVVVVHNYPTPYRLPIFERLARDVDLEVLFCAPKESGRQWAPTRSGVPSYRAHVARSVRVGPFVFPWSLPLQLWRTRAEVVILADDQSTVVASLITCVISRLRSTPLLFWTEQVLGSPPAREGGSLPLRAGRAIYRRIRRRLIGSAAAVLSMSGRASAEELEGLLGAPPPHLYVGTQIMPLDLMPAIHERRSDGKVRLLFVGYLRPEKNVAALIRAFLDVGGPDEELLIVGDGPERRTLEALAAGAANVVFTGHLNGDERDSLLCLADALVLPSTYEPWGLVVNEGLFVGTPVIACRDVGAAELIADGGTGLLYSWDPGDADLRRTLAQFLSDAPLRRRLARRAEAASTDRLWDLESGCGHILTAVTETAARLSRGGPGRR